jgi:SAM-dependent methyltransferase
MERGRPIDRYYIEAFLKECSPDVKGRALELGDASYIRRFGAERVTQTDVLSYVAGGEETTIVADLTSCPHIPDGQFDCIIFTQALQMIYDLKAAMRELYRILKPGGVLLLTTHGTSKIARRLGKDDWGEYWRLTAQGLDALVSETMPGVKSDVRVYGNVLTATAFLYGLAAEDLTPQELDVVDDDFEVLVAARLQKPEHV